ncbi:MAG TPA: hypothetical protein VLF63_01020 [Patescibacteria group bacterium]|nr:hypothetical protein [Patescibacteria group bacterium]
MTATNHALTGTAIGLLVSEPLLAIPIAFISHYVCDAIPHFGISGKDFVTSSKFKKLLIAEAAICFLIVLSLFILKPQHWLVAIFCAFLAASPDLLSINRFRRINNNLKWQPNIYSRFSQAIQWFEKPIGSIVELTWLISAIIIILPLIGLVKT